jgi:hypothetical protein
MDKKDTFQGLPILKAVWVIGAPPTQAPVGWRIYNAARPLYGDVTWQGDFITGVHFAAIDPKGPDALAQVQRDQELDARHLVYLTPETWSRIVDAYTEQLGSEYGVDARDFDRVDVEDSCIDWWWREAEIRIVMR